MILVATGNANGKQQVLEMVSYAKWLLLGKPVERVTILFPQQPADEAVLKEKLRAADFPEGRQTDQNLSVLERGGFALWGCS